MQESLQHCRSCSSLRGDGALPEAGLRRGSMVPGAINVIGVFLLGWGFYHSLVLNMLSSSVAMGIGMYPLFKLQGDARAGRRCARRGRRSRAGAYANGAQAAVRTKTVVRWAKVARSPRVPSLGRAAERRAAAQARPRVAFKNETYLRSRAVGRGAGSGTYSRPW